MLLLHSHSKILFKELHWPPSSFHMLLASQRAARSPRKILRCRYAISSYWNFDAHVYWLLQDLLKPRIINCSFSKLVLPLVKILFEVMQWAQFCFHWIQRLFCCTPSPRYTGLKHDKNLGKAEPWICCEICPLSCDAWDLFGPHFKHVSIRKACDPVQNVPFCASISTLADRSAFWQFSDANVSAFSSLIEQRWHNGLHSGLYKW